MQYAISRYGLAEILAPIYTKYELAYPCGNDANTGRCCRYNSISGGTHWYISRVRSEQVLYQVFPSVFREDTYDRLFCRAARESRGDRLFSLEDR